MGTKIGFVLGFAAGAYAFMKMSPDTIAKVREVAGGITESSPVQRVSQVADDTVGEAIRNKGQQLTDSVADSIKEKFFTK